MLARVASARVGSSRVRAWSVRRHSLSTCLLPPLYQSHSLLTHPTPTRSRLSPTRFIPPYSPSTQPSTKPTWSARPNAHPSKRKKPSASSGESNRARCPTCRNTTSSIRRHMACHRCRPRTTCRTSHAPTRRSPTSSLPVLCRLLPPAFPPPKGSDCPQDHNLQDIHPTPRLPMPLHRMPLRPQASLMSTTNRDLLLWVYHRRSSPFTNLNLTSIPIMPTPTITQSLKAR